MNTDARELSEPPKRESIGRGREAVYEDLANALRRKASRDYDDDLQYIERRHKERREGGVGNHATFNGSTKFVNTMLTVIALLMVAGISGEIIVYGKVESLATTVQLIVDGKIRIPQ
jgi:hypothetical protein